MVMQRLITVTTVAATSILIIMRVTLITIKTVITRTIIMIIIAMKVITTSITKNI